MEKRKKQYSTPQQIRYSQFEINLISVQHRTSRMTMIFFK